MVDRSFGLAVLGAGPAGLVAALRAAQHMDVALVLDRMPLDDDPPRVDAIPAPVLALLVELGVDPRAFGVDRLYHHRWIAWSTGRPQVRRVSPTGHVERPLFDRVLLSHVFRHPRIAVFLSRTWARADGAFWGDGWRASRLIDATGRAAVTADSVVRPERPWASRTLWRSSKRDGCGPPFALAPLPDGYVYLIEGHRRVVVGLVGRGAAVEGPFAELEGRLRDNGAGWMLDGLPRLSEFEDGRSAVASVQWSASSTARDGASRPVRIGDAALARDPISSQGIATACSEALFAVAIQGSTDVETFELRQDEQRQAHLSALAKSNASCTFSRERTWREYGAFLSQHNRPIREGWTGALRRGAVVRVDRPGSAFDDAG